MRIDFLHIEKDERNSMFIVKNTQNNRYVKLGERELGYLFEVKEINQAEFVLNKENELSIESKEILYKKFNEWGFLTKDLEANNQKSKSRFKDLAMINILKLNPTKVLNKMYPALSIFFSKPFVVLLILLIVLKYYLFINSGSALFDMVENLKIDSKTIIFLYVSMVITTILHELGHAVVCRKYGGNVNSMGIVLFFFMPCLYCDVSDIYLMRNRKASLFVSAAGLYTNLLLGNSAAIAYFILRWKNIDASFLLLYSFLNLGLVIYNVFPLVKHDGYWMLTSIVGINNLMDKSIMLFINGIFNIKEYSLIKIPLLNKLLITLFGFAAFVFRPFFWYYSAAVLFKYINKIPNHYIVLIIEAVLILTILYDMGKTYLGYIKKYRNDRNRILSMLH